LHDEIKIAPGGNQIPRAIGSAAAADQDVELQIAADDSLDFSAARTLARAIESRLRVTMSSGPGLAGL